MASKKTQIANPQVISPVQQIAAIQKKFKRLAEVRQQIAQLKNSLYPEHDQIVSELLPLFIETQTDQFIVKREITIGNEKHRLVPYFYDEKKGVVLTKQWKSTCQQTMDIE
jgi:hypothetical protein